MLILYLSYNFTTLLKNQNCNFRLETLQLCLLYAASRRLAFSHIITRYMYQKPGVCTVCVLVCVCRGVGIHGPTGHLAPLNFALSEKRIKCGSFSTGPLKLLTFRHPCYVFATFGLSLFFTLLTFIYRTRNLLPPPNHVFMAIFLFAQSKHHN